MTNRYRYKLEYLISLFKEHEIQISKYHQSLVDEFQKDYPDQPLPATLNDQFNLPTALKSICEEILDLRSELDNYRKET